MEHAWEHAACESWRRDQLRMLDAGLYELENAHERGEVVVSPTLATSLAHVPGVGPGMLITQALDRVFRAQEPLLLVGSNGSQAFAAQSPVAIDRGPAAIVPYPGVDVEDEADDDVAALPPLDEAGARSLTEAIRGASRQVCLLLLEAHERCAWSVLGYPTWEQYVRREFGLSRSRSYELLDQGRVIVSVKRAAGLGDAPDISPYAAVQVKPHLRDLLRDVRARALGRSQPEAEQAIAEIVREFRARVPPGRQGPARRPERPSREQAPAAPGEADLAGLWDLVHGLIAMPPPEEVVAYVPAEKLPTLDALEAATDWLARFVSGLRRRSGTALHRAPPADSTSSNRERNARLSGIPDKSLEAD